MIAGGIKSPDEFATDAVKHWWRYGEYTGHACPKCDRLRLMTCTDSSGVDRVICEKCHWEPARNDYCAEALSDR